MIAQSTLHGTGAVVSLWAFVLVGWVAVVVTLRRGLTGDTRDAAVTAHAVTLVLMLLRGTVLGYGLLPMMIVAGSLWWTLLLVSGFRPERLVAPPAGARVRLAVWLSAAGAAAAAGHWLIVS